VSVRAETSPVASVILIAPVPTRASTDETPATSGLPVPMSALTRAPAGRVTTYSMTHSRHASSPPR
jgi:hypothetical protein